jgi:hypothetical protein
VGTRQPKGDIEMSQWEQEGTPVAPEEGGQEGGGGQEGEGGQEGGGDSGGETGGGDTGGETL